LTASVCGINAEAEVKLRLSPDTDDVAEGFRILREVLRVSIDTKVIVVSNNEDSAHASRTVSMGAYVFLQTPMNALTLDSAVTGAFELYDFERQINANATKEREPAPLAGFLTRHPPMLDIFRKLKKVANIDITCLFLGESGTGKEVLARALHGLSRKNAGPFVVINCGAIPESLVESELFGFEKGSFTGAEKRTVGKIESAHNGTLFLDELGDMPLSAQAKLLRFIQERVVERVGGRVEIPVDVRIVCATNKDLKTMVAMGTFREDLYFRVSELVINVPPLRNRSEDKLILSRIFLNQFVLDYGRRAVDFDESAIAAIDAYTWPGNVRELINKVKNAVALSESGSISSVDLSLETAAMPVLNLKYIREGAERTAIAKALAISKGKVTAAAKLLGVTRPTRYDLFRRYGIKNDHKVVPLTQLVSHQISGWSEIDQSL
tara:strand:- start:73 stop:1383 length:1311 start_codon:yes stop_codon:yes gene_type:complete